MTKLGTVQHVPEIIPEGTYKAYPSATTETESCYGDTLKIEFTLVTKDEFNGRQVNGLCRNVINEKSKLGRCIAAITKKPLSAGEDINQEDILHKNCQIIIKHTQKDNNTFFANVSEVLPLDEKDTEDDDDLPF